MRERKKCLSIILIATIVASTLMLSGCVEEEQPTNNAPEASFTYTMENTTVTFLDTSTDADVNDTLTYSWSFGDENTSTEMNPIYTYGLNGTYTVVLTVSDGTDTDTATEDIVVGNVAPTASFTWANPLGSVVFTDASTDPNGDDTIVSWSWDFDSDGIAENETQGPIEYMYAAVGSYNATLTVIDDYGLTDSYTVEITIYLEG